MKRIMAVLLTMSLLAVICSLVMACEEELPTAKELIEKCVEAYEDINSYEMEMNTHMREAAYITGEEMLMDSSINEDANTRMTGAYDEKEQELSMVVSIEISVPDEDPMKIDMEIYFVDGWTYARMGMPSMEPQWVKSKMMYDELTHEMGETGFIKPQMELLKSADADVTGIEKVGDVNCYVLELTPDRGDFWDMVMQQVLMTGGGTTYTPMEDLEEKIRSYSVKYWIDKNKYFLIKADIAANIEIALEAIGIFGEEGSVKMDITMTMRMFNYNKPVSIALPPEAQDAVEGTLW